MLRTTILALAILPLLGPLTFASNPTTPAIQFNPDQLVTGWIIEPNGLSVVGDDTNNTAGWNFVLTETATVAKLGVFDRNGDGLTNAYEVGIWQGSELLISTEVPQGEVANLDGGWRSVPVQPLTLSAGHYAIGAKLIPTFGVDSESEIFYWNFDVSSNADSSLVPVDQRVNVDFSAPRYSSEPGFRNPDSALLVQGAWVGPNVFFLTVPEPTSASILIIASVFLTSASRRCSSL